MKIEKGKLYYDTTSSSIFKADEDGDNHNGFASDKIAVHCPTKEDWDYVKLFYKNILSTTSDHYYPDVNVRLGRDNIVRLDRDNIFDKRRYIEGYYFITIDEFKKFYPEKEQQPTHFEISPDDYYEYQELKKLKETLKKLIS